MDRPYGIPTGIRTIFMREANMKSLRKPNQCWEDHIKWFLKYGLSGHGLQCVNYEVCPKSNENKFFAQCRRARKGKWGSRQEEGEPRYTV